MPHKVRCGRIIFGIKHTLHNAVANKYLIDKFQYLRGRTKRHTHTRRKGFVAFRIILDFLEELLRLRALERIYRLLFIPHSEKRSGLRNITLLLVELLGQSINNIPLRRRGILGFIQQDMLYPAIKFIAHPLRDFAAAQQVSDQ